MLLKGSILYFNMHISYAQCIEVLTLESKCPILRCPFMIGLRTGDQLQWAQMASDERHIGLTSTSDEHQTSFTLDQITVS